jgi:tyrosyl-tRNA synthetase
LQMDEETTLRFFSRKSAHKLEQDEIQEKIKSNIDNLDVILKSSKAATTEELKSKIDEINNLELQLEKNKVEFINSLSDILSYEQIAKMIIFEKRFRNEVRKLLMRDRRPPVDHE